jgi:hypothetical protein
MNATVASSSPSPAEAAVHCIRALMEGRRFAEILILPELIARCAPTLTEGLNMRGIFRFPIELYLEQLLPS